MHMTPFSLMDLGLEEPNIDEEYSVANSPKDV